MASQIDHVIIKLPYKELQDPPAWLTQAFNLSPGGRHADGLTENRLIVFKDGSYIELIAFVDEQLEASKGHWWYPHPYGIVDWALTSTSVDDIVRVKENISKAALDQAIGYVEPLEGGRTGPHGAELRWKVTFPQGVTRGEVPFWCHDLTSRLLRVPNDEIATTHPSGALGISRITLAVPESKWNASKKFYSTLLLRDANEVPSDLEWQLGTFNSIVGLSKPGFVIVQQFSGQQEAAVVTSIALFTDTIGIGQSRNTIVDSFGGGEEIEIGFDHGRRA